MHRLSVLLSAILLIGSAPSSLMAQSAEPAAKSEAKAPATATVAAETLRVDVSLSGILAPTDGQDVILSPKSWKSWTYQDAASHGQLVKAGDVILQLDDKDLKDAIEKLERDLANADIALKKAEILAPGKSIDRQNEHRRLEIAAERAAQDLADYQKADRQAARKSAKLKHAAAQQKLAYEQEEMKQLAAMYKSDDLVETSESIVMQRQRNALEHYAHAALLSQLQFDRYDRTETLRDETEARQAKDAARALAEKQQLLPLEDQEATAALADQRRNLQEMREKLADHRADLELLTHRASQDGVVYRGRFVDDKFIETPDKLFVAEAKLPTNQPLLTVVAPTDLILRGMVSEADAGHLKTGLSAAIETTIAPGVVVTGSLSQLSAIPVSPGKYAVTVAIDKPTPACFVAGAGAVAYLTPVYRTDVPMLPAKFVHRDPTNPGKRFVWLQTDAAPLKTSVKTGAIHGDKIEIVEGLSLGDAVCLDDQPAK